MRGFIQSYNKESGKMVIQAVIPFVEIYKKAKFTFRVRPEDDPINTDSTVGTEMYQRQLSSEHVKDIKQYIRKTILQETKKESVTALFPTAMLLAFDHELAEGTYKCGDLIEFDLPENFYIVDGQHRLKAMQELFEESSNRLKKDSVAHDVISYLRRYFFSCSILVNYDIWEQARIFADVNFKQKKVSKSLYYEIYGMEYSSDPEMWKQNSIFLAHSLVEFLNISDISPLKGLIKMLGNTSKGIISQSFLVESFLRHIYSPRSIWYFDPYIVTVSPDSVRHMSVETVSYLTAIRESFKSLWPKIDERPNSIICKTTGMGALIRLLSDFHKQMPKEISMEIKNISKQCVCRSYVDYANDNFSKLKSYKDELFSIDPNIGQFCSTGGSGLEIKLYKRMKQLIFEPEMSR